MEILNNVPLWFWFVAVLAFLLIIGCTCYAIYHEVKFMAQRRENKALKEYNDMLLARLKPDSPLHNEVKEMREAYMGRGH